MVVDTIWSPASRVVATVIDRISSNSASFFKIDIPQVFSEPDVSRFKIIYQFVDCEYQGNPTSCNLRQPLERCRRDFNPPPKKNFINKMIYLRTNWCHWIYLCSISGWQPDQRRWEQILDHRDGLTCCFQCVLANGNWSKQFRFAPRHLMRKLGVLEDIGSVLQTWKWDDVWSRLLWSLTSNMTTRIIAYTIPCAPHWACRDIPRHCNSLPRPSTPHRSKWDPCLKTVRYANNIVLVHIWKTYQI